MARWSLIALSFFGFLCLVCCGGGSGSESIPPTSPAITSVSASCTPASIQTGQTSQCSATVAGTGDYSSAVTWSATNGTITATGVFTPTAAGTATINATSTQDSTKSGSAAVTVNSQGSQNSCNITAAGAIQADGSLGAGKPNLGDVYQIQGATPSENYVDDDEASNSTVTFTSPNSVSITVGMFLLNQHANGVNTFAARFAAGFQSKGVWVPGTWTWSMSYTDHQSSPYTCTATGSFTVASTWNAANGFLAQSGTTPNLYTDGNNQAFFGTGFGWFFGYYNGSSEVYNAAEVPCQVVVNVNGTAVTFVSGVNSGCSSGFTTQTLPSGVYNQITICPTWPFPVSCTVYQNVTINSATSMTLGSSGGTFGNLTAFVGFTRDLSTGHRALGYTATLAQAAQFYAAWGNNIDRFADTQNATVENTSGWLGTGYNTYNWNTNTTQGIPAIDSWFAAAHAAGIHIVFGGPNGGNAEFPCDNSYTCTTKQISNLQHFYAMIAARWGAFYDVLEFQNEGVNVPQTFLDYGGQVLLAGVSNIADGNPADPYGHFFTQSYFPNAPNVYSPTYGPFSTPYVSDAYLNFVEPPHIDGVSGQTIWHWAYNQNTYEYGCPGTVSPGLGGTTMPRYDGEMVVGLGIAPSSQSASNLNDEINAPRIADEQNILNQCSGGYFNSLSDQVAFNSSTPMVTSSWYDYGLGRVTLQKFMSGLDSAATPLTVTLGGGCGGGACVYEGLGSNSHIRLALNSATGNGATGVPNAVTAATVTLNVPQANMTYKWWNTATGLVESTGITSATAGRQTFTAPNFTVDMLFQIDP